MKHLEFDTICLFNNQELDEQKMLEVQQHLESCSECRQQLEVWQSFSAESITSSIEEVDYNFVRSVMRRLPEVKEPFSISDFIRSWAWQLGMLTASMAILFIAYNQQKGSLNDEFAQVFSVESSVYDYSN